MQASLRQGSRGAYDLAARSRSRCPLSLPLFPQPCSRPQLTSNTVRFASVRSRASASGTPGPQQPERPAGESQSSPQPGPEPQPVASTSAELVQQGVPSEAGSSQEPPLDVVEPSAVYEADNLQAGLYTNTHTHTYTHTRTRYRTHRYTHESTENIRTSIETRAHASSRCPNSYAQTKSLSAFRPHAAASKPVSHVHVCVCVCSQT